MGKMVVPCPWEGEVGAPCPTGQPGVSQGDGGQGARMTAALPTDHVDRADNLRNSLPPARHPALVCGDLHHHGEGGGDDTGALPGHPFPKQHHKPQIQVGTLPPAPSRLPKLKQLQLGCREHVLPGAPSKPLPRSPHPIRLCSQRISNPAHPVLEPPNPMTPSSLPWPCGSSDAWPRHCLRQSGPSSHVCSPPAEQGVSMTPFPLQAQSPATTPAEQWGITPHFWHRLGPHCPSSRADLRPVLCGNAVPGHVPRPRGRVSLLTLGTETLRHSGH